MSEPRINAEARRELEAQAEIVISIACALPPAQEVLAHQLAQAGRVIKALARCTDSSEPERGAGEVADTKAWSDAEKAYAAAVKASEPVRDACGCVLADDVTCASCIRPVCRKPDCAVWSEAGQALCLECYAKTPEGSAEAESVREKMLAVVARARSCEPEPRRPVAGSESAYEEAGWAANELLKLERESGGNR